MKTNLKSIVVIFILFVSFEAFANKGTIDPPEEVAIVHVYRPQSMIGFAWVFRLKVNDEFHDSVKNGKHVVLTLKPGKTTFSIKKRKVELELEAGKTYYLRSSIGAGFIIGRLDLVEVTESFALKEIIVN